MTDETRAFFWFVRWGIFWTLVLLLFGFGSLFAEKEADFNRWKSLFTEPFETLYIIMEDRVAFKCSNQDENEARMTLGKLEKQLRTKERSYEIKDIAVIIHNHLKGCIFSPTDRKLYWRLKKYGFRGLFLLYSHTSNKTYDIEDKAK